MAERDSQRFFNAAQRQALYEIAEGRCQRCSALLDEGWHADHLVPWADGGPTEIDNGQALCGSCNSKKGTNVQYTDNFVPRTFQREVITQVVERIRAGSDRTIVLASPGSGKTLAYQALATRLIREGLIDFVAVFVPRVALAEQCETGWMHRTTSGVGGYCLLFDSRKRLGKVRHRVNEVPLTSPGEPGSGFVSTYSALVTNERLFLDWARRHEGRFLLVGDEAQFCGSAGDKEDGGTKSGLLMEKLHDYAAHTLLLTGTPYRADNQPLILADYELNPSNPRRKKLVCHAEATYADGIAGGYLRKFEMQMVEAEVARRTLGDDSGHGETLLTYNLSDDGSDLVPVLRDEKVWKPLADRVVRAVRDKKRFNSEYRGLISCMQQNEARKVQQYIQQQHPDLRVGIAVSSDTDAPKALRDFKYERMDILVTVRMAFIGYDCPQITVVGILTNYRDGGHLMQLAGRGLRIWSDGPSAREQTCVIVTPDDPKMQGFLALLREEEAQGLRIIEEREGAEPAEPGTAVQEALSFVESATATTTRAASNEVDVESDELRLIEGYKLMADSGEDASKIKMMLELASLSFKQPVPEQRAAPEAPAVFEVPKTEREQIAKLNAEAASTIRQQLYQASLTPGAPGYEEAVKKATYQVNTASGFSAGEANTVEKATKRLRAAKALTWGAHQ
ncbi:HNH endonuclease [Kitasatospora sp. NPDC002040]|uniref:HNH endonuclease n=1 Tax=Kitasatospora sp. NPDC002040 TaxID=3154661 RepID=UPI003324029B